MLGNVPARLDQGAGGEDDDESDECGENESDEIDESHLLQGERQQAGQTWWEEDLNSGNQVAPERSSPV